MLFARSILWALIFIGVFAAGTFAEPPNKTKLDFNRPLFIGPHAYGCLMPEDLKGMSWAGMDAMDAGGRFRTCRKWGEGLRVRVIGKQAGGIYLDVFPVNRGNDIAGWDSWFFDSDLTN